MIAIISDIHGNIPALTAVIEELEKQNIRKIISLGDIAGYYPFINECIDLLKKNNVTNIMGNHDFYLVSGLGCPRSKAVNELAQIQLKNITSENLDWLSQSKICFKMDETIMVHGGFENPVDEYLYNISQKYFSRFNYKYFFSGHTHVQCVHYFNNGQVYCNPGSVGQPRDGNPKASYALFDGKQIYLKRIEYDPTIIENTLGNEGFDEYYYEGLRQGVRIGGKIDSIKIIK